MSRHLVLLPAPEAEWAQLSTEEHQKGMRSHEQFHRDLATGGHRIVAAGPLTPSAEGLSMRPDGSGGAFVTDGPFTETVEQVVGFYLLDSDDRADLVRVCTEFASRGELIELRDMEVGAEPEDQRPT
ncbi:MAG: YciI family protein [Ornithinibacter sp.]